VRVFVTFLKVLAALSVGAPLVCAASFWLLFGMMWLLLKHPVAFVALIVVVMAAVITNALLKA
jgi:hypothetical protein